MNCDYSKNPLELHTKKLQFISRAYQLEQLILEPTPVTNTSATQIDLLFTNDTRNIAQSGVIHIGLSDHSLIYMVRKFSIPKRRQVLKQVRNLKHFSEEDLNIAWKKWNLILTKSKYWIAMLVPLYINEQDHFLFHGLIPLLRRICTFVIIIKKQFVKHGSLYHWKLYQTARNKVNIEMRESKLRYYQQKNEECEKTNLKATWRLIDNLTGKSHKSNYVTEIELDNRSVVSGSDISEAFNDYCINIGPKLAAESTSISILIIMYINIWKTAS